MDGGGASLVVGNPLDLSMYSVMPYDSITCDVVAVDGDGASVSDALTVSVDNQYPQSPMSSSLAVLSI